MAGVKPTSKQRPSLCPPRGDRGSPNASMIDPSSVEISIRRHIRQRDQDTATKEELEQKLKEQRPSLLHAEEIIDYWKKRDSVKDSTNTEISLRNNVRQHDQETTTKDEQKEKLNEECPSIHHAFGLTDYLKKKHSPNDSTDVQTNNGQVTK